eukprot:CAMPEP_0194398670 /NCGR_PEP_ID=MMETSP0174-20130528/126236_1 /TAXON_ID=216777 /ORGANISM="Proboscia alata, Strain PI-D3" /LENGTH=617 /DNA_ID=CAMNT_0039194999 /DNA_START=68 /DNA_END=1919 /DNA_ORIENTATION=+
MKDHTATANADGVVDSVSNNDRRIFVSSLGDGCTQTDLKAAFQRYGPVSDVYIANQGKKELKRYAFVTFDQAEHAVDAISDHAGNDDDDDADAVANIHLCDTVTERLETVPLLYGEVKAASYADADADADADAVANIHLCDTVTERLETVPLLYGEVKAASIPKPRTKSNRRKEISFQKEEECLILERALKQHQQANVGQTNNRVLVLQCHSSHVDRLDYYLSNEFHHLPGKTSEGLGLSIIGVKRNTGSRNVSLLFVGITRNGKNDRHSSVMDDNVVQEVANRIANDNFLKSTLNRVFVVDNNIRKGREGSIDDVFTATNTQLGDLECDAALDTRSTVLRVQTFPPKIQKSVIGLMETKFDEIKLSPTNFDGVLSVIQIYPDAYMFGVVLNAASASHGTAGTFVTNNRRNHNNDLSGDDEDDVSRAYYKLQEAFIRFSRITPPRPSTSSSNQHPNDVFKVLQNATAMDCGSAPGGWTKFLIENGCAMVYSIDPGDMSPIVTSNSKCHHLKMKTQDAILKLGAANGNNENNNQKEGNISVYVSDMCLHTMQSQIDLLLEAKAKGLLSSTALFVLTLKCIVGRSKASYDHQAQKAVETLMQRTSADATTTAGVITSSS